VTYKHGGWAQEIKRLDSQSYGACVCGRFAYSQRYEKRRMEAVNLPEAASSVFLNTGIYVLTAAHHFDPA
jgi:hypothetical protein